MMKNRMTKKLICSALIFILAAGLIGCGGEKKEKEPQEEVITDTEESSRAEEEVITAEYEEAVSEPESSVMQAEDMEQEYHIDTVSDITEPSYTISISKQEKSYEDEEGKIVVEASYETLTSQDADEDIRAIIDTYNQAAEADADFFIEYTKTHLDLFPPEFTNRYSAQTEIKRADNRFLSIVRAETTEFAGAVPSTDYSSYNFNVATGKQMRLANIVREENLVAGKIAEKLLTENPDVSYFAIEETDGTMAETLPALTNAISEYLDHNTQNPTDDTEHFWYLDSDGIGFVFDSYEIAPGADGTQEVRLSYDELQTVLDEAEIAQTIEDLEQDSHMSVGNMEIYYVDADVKMTGDTVGDIFAGGLFYMENSIDRTKGLLAFTADQTLTWDLASVEEADAFLRSVQDDTDFLTSEWEECGNYFVKKSILYTYNEPPVNADPAFVTEGYKEAAIQINAVPKSSSTEPVIYTAMISVTGNTEEESYAPKKTTFTSITEAMRSILPGCSLIPDDYVKTLSELRYVYYYGTTETDPSKLDPEKVRRNQWVIDTFGASMDGSTERCFASLTDNEVKEYLLWVNDPKAYEANAREMKSSSGQIPDDIAQIQAKNLIETQMDWAKYAYGLSRDITGQVSGRYTYMEGLDENNQDDVMTRVEGCTNKDQYIIGYDSYVILQPDYVYDEASDTYLPTEMRVVGSRDRRLEYNRETGYLEMSAIDGRDKPYRNDDIHGTLEDYASCYYRYTVDDETQRISEYDYSYNVSMYMGAPVSYTNFSECEYDSDGFLIGEEIEYRTLDFDNEEMSRRYTYDKNGLLTSMEDTAFGHTQTFVFTYEDNRLKEIHDKDYPNQTVYTFEYDNFGRLSKSTLIYDMEFDPETDMMGSALNWETYEYHY